MIIYGFISNNFANIPITSGCSCDLFEESHDQPWPGDVFWYSAHCGKCSEYGFYCGSCRCVPPHFCLSYTLDGNFYSQVRLDWDDATSQWGDDSTDDITIHFASGGDCQLVVYYEGDPLYLYVPNDDSVSSPTYSYELAEYTLDCQKESWAAHSDDEFNHPLGLPDKEGVRLTHRTKCRRSDADAIAFSHEGYLHETSGFMYVSANSSQDENCYMISCDSFIQQNCPEACIENPKTLNATLILRTGDGEYDTTWPPIETELNLVVQPQGDGVFYCEYVGTTVVECTVAGETVYEGWTISSRESGFSFGVKYWVEVSGSPVAKQMSSRFGAGVSISCDPLYVETGWGAVESDPDTLGPAGILCTGGEAEEDRPSDANLIITA
jgi:hypothetical protein